MASGVFSILWKCISTIWLLFLHVAYVILLFAYDIILYAYKALCFIIWWLYIAICAIIPSKNTITTFIYFMTSVLGSVANKIPSILHVLRNIIYTSIYYIISCVQFTYVSILIPIFHLLQNIISVLWVFITEHIIYYLQYLIQTIKNILSSTCNAINPFISNVIQQINNNMTASQCLVTLLVGMIILMLFVWIKYEQQFTRMKMEMEEKRNLCGICVDHTVNSVITPCGHQFCCYSCSQHIMNTNRECPVCRQKIYKIYETFMAGFSG
eukprot:66288_1